MSKAFWMGQCLRTWVYWRDYNDDLVDPTQVYLDVRDPSGNVDTYQYSVDPGFTHSSTGYYLYETVDLDEVGAWNFRWRAEGAYQGAVEFRIVVRESAFD